MQIFFLMDFALLIRNIVYNNRHIYFILSFNFLALRKGLCVKGALTQILEQTKEDFFSKILNIMRDDADFLYERIKEIPCLTCPHKPEGSMVVMVRT
jgi:hypothetical protein